MDALLLTYGNIDRRSDSWLASGYPTAGDIRRAYLLSFAPMLLGAISGAAIGSQSKDHPVVWGIGGAVVGAVGAELAAVALFTVAEP